MTIAIEAPHEVLWNVTNAAISARALQVVAELGVADHIADGPVPVAELAARVSSHSGALDRLLQLLTCSGIFERTSDGYVHTESSRLLREDHPRSMRPFARMMGLPVFLDTFNALRYSADTGAPALDTVSSHGLWSYLKAHPAEAGVFAHAMRAKAHHDTEAVLGSYDFQQFGTIADIAGGQGHLIEAVLAVTPAAEGVLFELPGVIDTLPPAPDGLTYSAGDMFVDPLPRADLYVLMEVIHDWPDRDAVTILSAVRNAAQRGATVLLVEGVLPTDRNDTRAHTLDVIMLAVTGGRERSAADLQALLRKAGFRPTRVLETSGPMWVVEAVAA